VNTSSSADGISADGVIGGTGVHNGETRADAMVPVTPSPTPTPMPTPTPIATPHLNSDSCATSYSYTKGGARRHARDRNSSLALIVDRLIGISETA
jgi:hypothetical protein